MLGGFAPTPHTPPPTPQKRMTQRTASIWSVRQPVPRATATMLSIVMPVLVLGVWCVFSYGGLAPADFLPSPTEVVRGTLQLFLQYDLWTAIVISTRRTAMAFLLASSV